MNKTKYKIYLVLGLGMLAYAVPQLSVGEGWSLPTLFSIAWIGFALLVIAANLRFILSVDEETYRELQRVKRIRAMQLERMLLSRSNR
jgi:hypothetical protein